MKHFWFPDLLMHKSYKCLSLLHQRMSRSYSFGEAVSATEAAGGAGGG